MRKKLATARSFVLSDKTHARDECLQIMKSVGINDMDSDQDQDQDQDSNEDEDEAEDCMAIDMLSVLCSLGIIATLESDMIQQIKELVKHVEVLMNFLEEEFKPTYVQYLTLFMLLTNSME